MNHLQNTRFIFNKYARSYMEKYLDQSNYARALLAFAEGIPRGGKVLDLGCGPGNISRFLLDERSDLQITGVDIAPAMIAMAEELNPEAEFEVGNVLDVARFKEGDFDGVISGFVLPYLDPEQLILHLQQMAALLKPSGVCYLSFPEGKEEDSGFVVSKNTEGEALHMYYHRMHVVEQLAGKAGLHLVFTDKKTPRSENGEPTNMEIMMILRSS